jgi:hypothetical protein
VLLQLTNSYLHLVANYSISPVASLVDRRVVLVGAMCGMIRHGDVSHCLPHSFRSGAFRAKVTLVLRAHATLQCKERLSIEAIEV